MLLPFLTMHCTEDMLCNGKILPKGHTAADKIPEVITMQQNILEDYCVLNMKTGIMYTEGETAFVLV